MKNLERHLPSKKVWLDFALRLESINPLCPCPSFPCGSLEHLPALPLVKIDAGEDGGHGLGHAAAVVPPRARRARRTRLLTLNTALHVATVLFMQLGVLLQAPEEKRGRETIGM